MNLKNKDDRLYYLEFLPLIFLMIALVVYFFLTYFQIKALLIVLGILFLSFIVSGFIVAIQGLKRYELAKKSSSITDTDKFIRAMSLLNLLTVFVVAIIISISFVTAGVTGSYLIK